jgi:Uma2 family endonuclease
VVKRNLYAAHGVGFYWIVDPMERTLDALRLEGGRWVVLGGFTDGDLVRIEPFEAVELEIERLFPPRTPG